MSQVNATKCNATHVDVDDNGDDLDDDVDGGDLDDDDNDVSSPESDHGRQFNAKFFTHCGTGTHL